MTKLLSEKKNTFTKQKGKRKKKGKMASKVPAESSASSVLDGTLLRLYHCRVEVTLDDQTMFVGKLVSLDLEGNLVLQDAERCRVTKKGATLRESVGLVFLRGSSVVRVGHTPGITTSAAVVDSRLTR